MSKERSVPGDETSAASRTAGAVTKGTSPRLGVAAGVVGGGVENGMFPSSMTEASRARLHGVRMDVDLLNAADFSSTNAIEIRGAGSNAADVGSANDKI